MQKYIVCFLLFISFAVKANNDIISVESAFSVSETATRFESIVKSKGMTIFNRIDHAAAAQKIGQKLRPTELIIFGNPKIGTALMLCQQSVALDLPQKVLIWQDENKRVWLSYNKPQNIALRHSIIGCEAEIAKIQKALSRFAKLATSI